jgi:hypothetical protein
MDGESKETDRETHEVVNVQAPRGSEKTNLRSYEFQNIRNLEIRRKALLIRPFRYFVCFIVYYGLSSVHGFRRNNITI